MRLMSNPNPSELVFIESNDGVILEISLINKHNTYIRVEVGHLKSLFSFIFHTYENYSVTWDNHIRLVPREVVCA